MKNRVVVSLVVVVFLSSSGNTFAKFQKIKRIEPGRWAFSFQGFGDISTNDRTRKKFRTGLGGGGRFGYGFWQGLSIEGEFQYDLLFREGEVTDDGGNKHLFNINTGLRYTVYLLEDDIAWYGVPLVGLTYDWTKGEVSSFDFNYALETGIDINLTENLSVGPLFKYRHVVEDNDVQYITIGAAFSYLFD